MRRSTSRPTQKQFREKLDRQAYFSSARCGGSAGNDVAAAGRFGKVLHRADERNEIERRVDGTGDHTFLADRAAERRQGDDAANPRHRTHETPSDSPTGISLELREDRHALGTSKVPAADAQAAGLSIRLFAMMLG
jgi:hypothetical protein